MAEPTFWGPSCGSTPSTAITSSIINIVGPGLYGVVGDGVADDTAALQSAIDDSYGKILAFVVGEGIEYRITSELVITEQIQIWGNGATINGADLPVGTGLGLIRAFHIYGTADTATPTPVTASLVAGQTAVSVTDSSQLAKGDIVLVSNTEPMLDGYANAASRKGYLSYVYQVDSPVLVTLATGAQSAMSHTATLTLTKINPLRGIRISDLKIQMGGVFTVHGGFRMEYLADFVFRNVEVYGAEDQGFSTRQCYGGVLEECAAHDSTSAYTWNPSWNTGYGFVFLDASRNITLRHSRAVNCRRACTGGNLYPAIFITIEDNHADNCDNAWGNHEPCFNWTIKNNYASGLRGIFITVRGSRHLIQGNRCVGSAGNGGIRVRTYYDTPEGINDIQIIDNHLEYTGGPGIWLEGIDIANDAGGGGPVSQVIIRGGSIKYPQSDGIYIQKSSNVLIDGVMFEGQVELYSTDGNGVYINGADNGWDVNSRVTVQNCTFKGTLRNAVRADYMTGLTVSNCRAIDFVNETTASSGIYCFEVDDIILRDNDFDMSNGYHGYYLVNCDNVLISGGKIRGGSSLGSQDLIIIDHADGATGSRCQNITIDSISVETTDRYGMFLRYIRDLKVTNCNSNTAGTFYFKGCDYITANNNNLVVSPAQLYCYRIEDCLRLTATGNYFEPLAAVGGAGIECIRTSGKMETAIITGNNFGAFSSGYGVLLSDVNYPIVTGNNFVSVVGGNKISITGALKFLVSGNIPGSIGLWKVDVNGTTATCIGDGNYYIKNAAKTTLTFSATQGQTRIQATVDNGRSDNEIVDANGYTFNGMAGPYVIDSPYACPMFELEGTDWRMLNA